MIKLYANSMELALYKFQVKAKPSKAPRVLSKIPYNQNSSIAYSRVPVKSVLIEPSEYSSMPFGGEIATIPVKPARLMSAKVRSPPNV